MSPVPHDLNILTRQAETEKARLNYMVNSAVSAAKLPDFALPGELMDVPFPDPQRTSGKLFCRGEKNGGGARCVNQIIHCACLSKRPYSSGVILGSC